MTLPSPGIRSNPGAGRNAAVMAADTAITPGIACQLTATVAGQVTVLLQGGSNIPLTLAVGDNVYPYAVVSYASSGLTATISHAYNIY